MSLLELVSAYEPFAAEGRRATLRLVTAVLDSEGAVLEAPASETAVALEPGVASLITSLLESVVKEGTARSLAALGFTAPAAGKTGTTNDGRDAWFVGYTPALLTGVWVGDDENRALKLTGAKDALPLWAAFMKEAGADRPGGTFARAENIVEVSLCPASGMLARSGCPGKRAEVFLSGTEPLSECALHRGGLRGWFAMSRSFAKMTLQEVKPMSPRSRLTLIPAVCALAVLAALALNVHAAKGAFDDLDQEQGKARPEENVDPAQQMRDDLAKAQRKMRADVDEVDRRKQEDFSRLSAQMEEQYRDMARKMTEQSAWFRKSVEQQWTEFKDSTPKEWVDYSPKGDSRSKVDFEKGRIEVEVLVPVEEVAPAKKNVTSTAQLDEAEQAKLHALAEEKIREQTKKMVATKEEHKVEVLKDQVKTPEGAVVTEKNADSFVKEQLAPRSPSWPRTASPA